MPGVDYCSVPAWRISDFTGIDQLRLVHSAVSPPARKQVAVQLRAVSLNHRDLMIVEGNYPGEKETKGGGLILCSDGAGVVADVGEGVTDFKLGDRVAITFHANWESGAEQPTRQLTTGGSVQGTLTTLGVYEDTQLVHIPDSLSFEEAATLPCAAVTAWSALIACPCPISPGSTVLVLGTGGVSVFAAQIARAAGARVIATSSSDDKLQTYRTLSLHPSDLINYSKTPDWATRVRQLCPSGVDNVVEVGGAKTLGQSLRSVRRGGLVTIIGSVGGGKEEMTAAMKDILKAAAVLRPVLVGSRQSFRHLLHCVESTGLKPVINRVFSFPEVTAALRYLKSQQHVGKVVL